jgi:hypothetical protein
LIIEKGGGYDLEISSETGRRTGNGKKEPGKLAAANPGKSGVVFANHGVSGSGNFRQERTCLTLI